MRFMLKRRMLMILRMADILTEDGLWQGGREGVKNFTGV
jgi:hypothetical protein